VFFRNIGVPRRPSGTLAGAMSRTRYLARLPRYSRRRWLWFCGCHYCIRRYGAGRGPYRRPPPGRTWGESD